MGSVGHLSRERDGIAVSGMSKTVVEQSHRAVSRSVVMAAEWEWERTGDKTDRTTGGGAAGRGEREGGSEGEVIRRA